MTKGDCMASNYLSTHIFFFVRLLDVGNEIKYFPEVIFIPKLQTSKQVIYCFIFYLIDIKKKLESQFTMLFLAAWGCL